MFSMSSKGPISSHSHFLQQHVLGNRTWNFRADIECQTLDERATRYILRNIFKIPVPHKKYHIIDKI